MNRKNQNGKRVSNNFAPTDRGRTRRGTASTNFVEMLESRRLLSSTYYVSPTGSDSNPGTSPSQPWQTVAKVNASSFQPGDTILFQYGSQFRASLTASSSGSTSAPITFGAYGDSTLGNPEFIGSDVLNPASFTLVTGNTYSISSSTAINWVYDNHQFVRESQDVLTQNGSSNASDPATNISYVEANTDFFYYDSATTTLYLNLGGSLTGQTITAATRQDAVFSNGQSNLVFTNLDVTETAGDNGGYGIRVQGGSNVQVLNCSASLTGKHAIGAIDVTDFLGENLTADQSQPDQGFGGASAFVSFSDATRTGDTYQWINDTYTNPNGQYPVFITHGNTGSIASILLKNIVSLNGYGTGMFCESAGSSEVITIQGGEIQGGVITLGTNNSIVNGVHIDQADGGIELDGTGDVVQNCLFTGLTPNVEAGQNGGVVDKGTNNTIRFNTFVFTGGPAVNLMSTTTNTSIYANIFDCGVAIALDFDGTGMFTSSYNVFGPSAGCTYYYGLLPYTFSDWQAQGYDTTSVMGDPGFVDAATGNYQLTADSPAVDFYLSTPDQTTTSITTDYAGDSRPLGTGYDAGAFEANIPITGSLTVSNITVPAPFAGFSGTALFTVTLSAPQTNTATVHYSTADGTAIAGTDYTASTGKLSFAPGVTTQTISVAIKPTLAADSSETFQLTLSSPNPGTSITTPTATATITNANETTVVFNKKTPETYTDAGGHKVSLKLGGSGSGTALFASGTPNPIQILLTGTTPASSFSITTIGGVTSFNDTVIQGPIGSINTTANLTGSLTITGAAGRLSFGNLADTASIALQGATGHPALKFGSVAGASLTSAAALASLSALSWTGSPAGSISAPSIGALAVNGAFAANLNLTGTGVSLASAKFGSITTGTWTIASATGTVSAATIDDWTTTFTGGLRSLSVPGSVTNASLRSSGNIASITIGSAVDSLFYAGVDSTLTTLPGSNSDFTTSNKIGSFTITAPHSTSYGFSNSFVAAAKITAIVVHRVQTDNSGTPFGFATESLGAITDTQPGIKSIVWNSRKHTSLPTFPGDFKVVLTGS